MSKRTDLLDSLVERVPYARYLGIGIHEDEGGFRYSLPFREELTGNPKLPALHGGVVAGLLENAAVFELLLRNPERPDIPKPVDFALDFLRSAGPLETHARCTVQRLGSRVALVQVNAWQKSIERPVASGRAHMLLSGNGAWRH